MKYKLLGWLMQLFRMLWVLSSTSIIVSGSVLASEAPQVMLDPTVHTQDSIAISLPIYILSVISTAGFTWIIAKYDNARLQEMRDLKRIHADELAEVRKEITDLKSSICRYPKIKIAEECDNCPSKDDCQVK